MTRWTDLRSGDHPGPSGDHPAWSTGHPGSGHRSGDRGAQTGDRAGADSRLIEGRSSRLHEVVTLVRLGADGSPRRATAAEAQLAADWVAADFGAGVDSRAWAAGKIAAGLLWFWVAEGKPVSLVAHQPPVFGVCRVGPVFTPEPHRRHGYAGALTAHVSGEILAAGHRACLYTDLDNPTSNMIYHQAGYRPVADFLNVPLP